MLLSRISEFILYWIGSAFIALLLARVLTGQGPAEVVLSGSSSAYFMFVGCVSLVMGLLALVFSIVLGQRNAARELLKALAKATIKEHIAADAKEIDALVKERADIERQHATVEGLVIDPRFDDAKRHAELVNLIPQRRELWERKLKAAGEVFAMPYSRITDYAKYG